MNRKSVLGTGGANSNGSSSALCAAGDMDRARHGLAGDRRFSRLGNLTSFAQHPRHGPLGPSAPFASSFAKKTLTDYVKSQ